METPVLVIGGDEEFINTVFRAKLAPHGIRIEWVWDRFSSPDYRVPKGCEGILIIKSAIGHGMADQAAAMARDAGVPWVRVEHRFSKALPLLRAVGMVEPKAKGKAEPSKAEKYAVVSDYLSQEIDKGRAPSRGEIRGVIKRAFGPHVRLPDSLIKKARNIIVANKATPTPKDEEPMATATASGDTEIQLAEWLVLLIEEKPEAGHAEWMERLRELTVGEVPAQKKLLALVKAVHAEQRAIWSQHHRKWTPEKRESVKVMRRGWLKRFLSEHLDEHGEFPSYTLVRDTSTKVLVKSIHTSMIKEAKDEVEQERGTQATTQDDSTGNVLQMAPPPRPPVQTATGNTTPTTDDSEQDDGDPPWLVHQRASYTEERIDTAAAFARKWKRGLSAAQAHDLDDWLNRLLRHGNKARTSVKVRDRFKLFRRKPLEFAGAILLIVPKGTTIPRTLAITAYKSVMRVGMSYYNIEMMANALRLTNRLMATDESKKHGGQKAAQTRKDNKAEPTVTEPVAAAPKSAVPPVPEGFFPSLRDAHQYFLSKAVSHVGKHSFRKLLEDGKLEGLRRGDGLYAPWMISTASIDRYISELEAETGIDPTDVGVDESDSELDRISAEASEWKAKAEEAIRQGGEWEAKAGAWKHKSGEHEARAADMQKYAEEWETKARTAGRDAATARQEFTASQAVANRIQKEHIETQALLRIARGDLTELEGAQERSAGLEIKLAEAEAHIVELDLALAETAMAGVAAETPEPVPEPQGISVSSDLISQVMASGYRLVIEPV